jgi:Uncharacterized protein conserved in bacteria
MRTLSGDVARRIALAAQGFADGRPPGPVTRRHLKKVLSRIHLLQLDSVNVAVRAHYAPLFARLGPYPQALVDDAAWSHRVRMPRMLVEYWAHAASLLPIEDWPLLRYRMRRYREIYGARPHSVSNTAPGLVAQVLDAVKDLGPVGAGSLERALGVDGPRPKGGWWNRSDVKRACEWLFLVGELTTGARRGFERLYDLPERVLPAGALAAPELGRADAARELIARSPGRSASPPSPICGTTTGFGRKRAGSRWRNWWRRVCSSRSGCTAGPSRPISTVMPACPGRSAGGPCCARSTR